MCGIIGMVSSRDVSPFLLDGLRRLEYRGYDSAGIATVQGGVVERRRAEGKLANLEAGLGEVPLPGTIGIGHTRWATHGGPSETNAHPHATARVAVVHNGIIENYQTLKAELQAFGCVFETETDTEVVAHLVSRYLEDGFAPRMAAAAAIRRLEGAFALAMVFAGEHDLILGARQGTPLAIGYGDGEMFLASDAVALASLTERVAYLEDGDQVEVTSSGATVYDRLGQEITRPPRRTVVSGAMVDKGSYEHFMLKEIHEQPDVIARTLASLVHPASGRIALPDMLIDLAAVPRITIVGCGTAYYAGAVAKYWFERIARVPVELDIASEFRYREPPMPAGGLTVFISQSGETLDTLEALRYAKRQGQTVLSIVNVPESTIARSSDVVLQTMAGPEIGVASTKAFTTQLTALACLALATARARGALSGDLEAELVDALRAVPGHISAALERDGEVRALAHEIAPARDVLYLGRGALYPLALEGALKLKEISYIHAEGYAAGEMKHGPIALIDDHVPVVMLAPGDQLFDKVASNAKEVAARGGRILLVTDQGARAGLDETASWCIEMPAVHAFVAPIVYALPVQLLAYHVAVVKGTDVDRPRNLAKSVTVE